MLLSMAETPGTISQEFVFTDTDFLEIAAIARREFGLDLRPSKRSLAYARLMPRLRQLSLSYFSDYISLLKNDSNGHERNKMVSALTTNVTRFFREAHHFDILRDQILPHIHLNSVQKKPVRIWSAGCASGQEPVSIAITLLEAFPRLTSQHATILATDVDQEIVRTAAQFSYTDDELEPLSDQIRSKYFPRKHNCGCTPEIKDLITFGWLNVHDEWPFNHQFDAVFCRNVVIYFDEATRAKLWQKVYKHLAPGGILFVGHSERVEPNPNFPFKNIGITTYQKPNSGAAA